MNRCPDLLCPKCDMHVKDCLCDDGDRMVARIVGGRWDRTRGDWESDAVIAYETRD